MAADSKCPNLVSLVGAHGQDRPAKHLEIYPQENPRCESMCSAPNNASEIQAWLTNKSSDGGRSFYLGNVKLFPAISLFVFLIPFGASIDLV